MKKCSCCGAIRPDTSTICALCGGDLEHCAEPKADSRLHPRTPRMALVIMSVCAGLAIYFLTKGEEGTYYLFAKGRSLGWHDVSALTYYFHWSAAKREEVKQSESYGNTIFQSYAPTQQQTMTLSEKISCNVLLAVFFCFGCLLSIVQIVVSRWPSKWPASNRDGIANNTDSSSTTESP